MLTILLQLLLARWQDVDPLTLRRCMAEMRWPQALLVACEFVRSASTDPELRHLRS